MPMYDIYNELRVKVDTIHAKEARYALADFLSRAAGTPEATRARREHIVANANQPSTRGAAEYEGVIAVRLGNA